MKVLVDVQMFKLHENTLLFQKSTIWRRRLTKFLVLFSFIYAFYSQHICFYSLQHI